MHAGAGPRPEGRELALEKEGVEAGREVNLDAAVQVLVENVSVRRRPVRAQVSLKEDPRGGPFEGEVAGVELVKKVPRYLGEDRKPAAGAQVQAPDEREELRLSEPPALEGPVLARAKLELVAARVVLADDLDGDGEAEGKVVRQVGVGALVSRGGCLEGSKGLEHFAQNGAQNGSPGVAGGTDLSALPEALALLLGGVFLGAAVRQGQKEVRESGPGKPRQKVVSLPAARDQGARHLPGNLKRQQADVRIEGGLGNQPKNVHDELREEAFLRGRLPLKVASASPPGEARSLAEHQDDVLGAAHLYDYPGEPDERLKVVQIGTAGGNRLSKLLRVRNPADQTSVAASVLCLDKLDVCQRAPGADLLQQPQLDLLPSGLLLPACLLPGLLDRIGQDRQQLHHRVVGGLLGGSPKEVKGRVALGRDVLPAASRTGKKSLLVELEDVGQEELVSAKYDGLPLLNGLFDVGPDPERHLSGVRQVLSEVRASPRGVPRGSAALFGPVYPQRPFDGLREDHIRDVQVVGQLKRDPGLVRASDPENKRNESHSGREQLPHHLHLPGYVPPCAREHGRGQLRQESLPELAQARLGKQPQHPVQAVLVVYLAHHQEPPDAKEVQAPLVRLFGHLSGVVSAAHSLPSGSQRRARPLAPQGLRPSPEVQLRGPPTAKAYPPISSRAPGAQRQGNLRARAGACMELVQSRGGLDAEANGEGVSRGELSLTLDELRWAQLQVGPEFGFVLSPVVPRPQKQKKSRPRPESQVDEGSSARPGPSAAAKRQRPGASSQSKGSAGTGFWASEERGNCASSEVSFEGKATRQSGPSRVSASSEGLARDGAAPVSTAPGSGSAHAGAASPGVGLKSLRMVDFKGFSLALLERLSKTPGSKWFLQPVDPELDGVPDYFAVIENPMDFQTIREKLVRNMYKNPFGWQLDMRLVFYNALKYHKEGNAVREDALSLATEFEQRCRETGEVNPYYYPLLLERQEALPVRSSEIDAGLSLKLGRLDQTLLNRIFSLLNSGRGRGGADGSDCWRDGGEEEPTPEAIVEGLRFKPSLLRAQIALLVDSVIGVQEKYDSLPREDFSLRRDSARDRFLGEEVAMTPSSEEGVSEERGFASSPNVRAREESDEFGEECGLARMRAGASEPGSRREALNPSDSNSNDEQDLYCGAATLCVRGPPLGGGLLRGLLRGLPRELLLPHQDGFQPPPLEEPPPEDLEGLGGLLRQGVPDPDVSVLLGLVQVEPGESPVLGALLLDVRPDVLQDLLHRLALLQGLPDALLGEHVAKQDDAGLRLLRRGAGRLSRGSVPGPGLRARTRVRGLRGGPGRDGGVPEAGRGEVSGQELLREEVPRVRAQQDSAALGVQVVQLRRPLLRREALALLREALGPVGVRPEGAGDGGSGAGDADAGRVSGGNPHRDLLARDLKVVQGLYRVVALDGFLEQNASSSGPLGRPRLHRQDPAEDRKHPLQLFPPDPGKQPHQPVYHKQQGSRLGLDLVQLRQPGGSVLLGLGSLDGNGRVQDLLSAQLQGLRDGLHGVELNVADPLGPAGPVVPDDPNVPHIPGGAREELENVVLGRVQVQIQDQNSQVVSAGVLQVLPDLLQLGVGPRSPSKGLPGTAPAGTAGALFRARPGPHQRASSAPGRPEPLAVLPLPPAPPSRRSGAAPLGAAVLVPPASGRVRPAAIPGVRLAVALGFGLPHLARPSRPRPAVAAVHLAKAP
ncbi:bromodomain protein [Cryptosporidium felis]|nr:bromodomain protein [Cryptosporidium felis]